MGNPVQVNTNKVYFTLGAKYDKKTATVHTKDGITYHQYDKNGDGKVDEIKKVGNKKEFIWQDKDYNGTLDKTIETYYEKSAKAPTEKEYYNLYPIITSENDKNHTLYKLYDKKGSIRAMQCLQYDYAVAWGKGTNPQGESYNIRLSKNYTNRGTDEDFKNAAADRKMIEDYFGNNNEVFDNYLNLYY